MSGLSRLLVQKECGQNIAEWKPEEEQSINQNKDF